MSVINNHHDAEDAWHNSLLRAWKGLHQLKEQDRFKAWLARIVLNEAKTLAAKRGKEPEPMAKVPDLADKEHSVTDVLAVHSSLQKLEPEQREAVVLRFWLDLSLQEIADATSVPHRTAKTRLYKGMNILQSLMKEENR